VTTEPDTTSPSTTASDASDATIAATPCRRITDFDADDLDGESGWFIVNDGVMGGGSNGIIVIGDSAMRFSGTVVTDGGGFTSVRYRLNGTEMAGSARLSMRVRADDRVYGVTLEDEAEVGQRSVSHRADLDTTGATDADGWMIATLDYTELQPSVFGRSVEAARFDPDTAREIGIIIADGIDGDFSLDVDWIDACD
jgi:NADH dehydrogenase [ubiquinone] 1 alpha subcomplex assembly factor 1